jgi:hypothetical protein
MGIELNEKDALNLQEMKDKMAELATGKGLLGSPDAAAAVAFAHLLDAETRREELVMKAAGQGKTTPVAEAVPSSTASWMETVSASKPVAAGLEA